jgi:hypothetical protein
MILLGYFVDKFMNHIPLNRAHRVALDTLTFNVDTLRFYNICLLYSQVTDFGVGFRRFYWLSFMAPE